MPIEQKSRAMTFPRAGRLIIIFFAIAFIIAGLRGYQLFGYIFSENVKNPGSITIPKEATFEQVLDSLHVKDILKNEKAFKWVSRKKNYQKNIKPGKYVFDKGMSTNKIVNMLRSGNQKPISVIFNNVRFMSELAGTVASYIEPDSTELINYMSDTSMMEELGFNKYSFQAMFIPNSYQFYWTTTPKQFVERMYSEYNRFWNDERLEKAKALGMTPVQVTTLASIVQEETIKAYEKPIIAGLYLNRLRKGMLLQADPTIKFALGDFGIQRVLNKYLLIDSPYNTYTHAGLPPGPINFPEISSIDAVLNAQKNNYLYMCASDSFNGTHNFARTLREHNENAKKYQEALNENKIWK